MKHKSGNASTEQFRRLGSSCDWDREYYTMDDNLSRGVVETFVRLHEQGLIYRGKRLVNWDPVLGTAVSDLEVVSEEEDGFMWEIRYPLTKPVDGISCLVVRSEEHTSELQSLMRISYAVFCLKKKTNTTIQTLTNH